MVRFLVKLGQWLDSRFPAKVTVTLRQYEALQSCQDNLATEVSMLRSELNDRTLSLNKILDRLSVVESSAVHKGAVSDLVEVVKTLKDDYISYKVSQGFTPKAVNHDLSAMLNGQYLEDSNG